MGDLNLALSALIGGASGALDAIDGAGLSDGDAAVVVLSTGVYHYHLNASSGATENSPYVISPDSNAGTKRWILVTPAGAFSHVIASRATAQSLPNAAETTFIFTSETKDILDEYNITTGRFTATYDGFYLINFNVTSEVSVSWAALEDMYGIVDINGVSTKRGFRYPAFTSSFGRGAIFSGTVYLAAGEYIDCDVYHNQGAAIDTWASADFNWLTIDRIA